MGGGNVMNVEEELTEVRTTMRFVDPVESWFELLWTDTESLPLSVHPWRESSFDLTVQSRENL
jgi:hypothetical protein